MAKTTMNCPICNKPSPKVIADTLRTGEKRKVFLCTRCDVGILDAHISAADLKKYYASEYRKIGRPKLAATSETDELFSIYSRFQDDRLRLLKPYLTKNTKLLEVGCSAGMFLYHVKPLVKEIVGIDFDLASAAYAAKKCHCKVYTTDIKETPLKKKYFDVIVAFQTLEHVSDPKAFIAGLEEYLAPGGVIAIEVPNLNDALAHVYNLPRHYQFFYHKSHLWYFTEKSLEKVMASSGFKGKTFHTQDYNIMNHMNWIVNDAPQGTPLAGLSAPVLPIRTNASPQITKTLDTFIKRMDIEYKKTLADLKITSNIIFIGKKK
jgi:2-polyprenyl-3-methyl-5-hydroxy-6-metoxy-1,4-benzoquinol methylase